MINAALYFLAFLSLSLTYRAFLQFFYRSELVISSRVEDYLNIEPTGKKIPKKEKVSHRIAEEKISGMSQKMKKIIEKRITAETKSELERKLRDAGFSYSWSAVDFRLTQLLIAALLFFVSFLLFGKASDSTMKLLFFSGALAGLGFYYPLFYLSARKKRRFALIQKSLADFFDMVNLSVEAGMGLDAAILRVCKNKEGPLSEEFLRAMDEMRLGKSRRDAFINLRTRITLDAFQSIMTSLIQADQLGIGMSKVLRALTDRIREHQRQLAREKAMKAPMKMLFPMILFIFPAIFIVLLGPLIIYLLQNGLGG